jgi:virulence factor Mce-like protein
MGRLAVLLQAAGALVFAVVLLHAGGMRLPFAGDGGLRLTAAFSDAGGLHDGENTPVLVAGVPAGTVTSVSEADGRAYVTMRLNAPARGVVRRDATAAIEPRSALQDLTINIAPGSPSAPAAASGMLIPVARTQATTTLSQAIAVLDADTRAELTVLVDGLAHGIRGRGGPLAAAIERLHGLLDPATRVTGALARRRALLAGLVGSLSRIGAVAAGHDGAIAATLRDGAATLRVTAARQAAVTGSIRALPSALTSIAAGLQRTRALAAPLVPVLRGAGPAAAALPGALASLRAIVRPAGRLLGAARAFAARGGAGLTAAASATAALGATATALRPALTRVQPIVSAVNARRDGIAQLGARFSGVLSTDDANGPILRGLGSFEPFNPADFGAPGASGSARARLAAQAALALTLTCRRGQLVACLVRYLIPGLPGGVR